MILVPQSLSQKRFEPAGRGSVLRYFPIKDMPRFEGSWTKPFESTLIQLHVAILKNQGCPSTQTGKNVGAVFSWEQWSLAGLGVFSAQIGLVDLSGTADLTSRPGVDLAHTFQSQTGRTPGIPRRQRALGFSALRVRWGLQVA